MHITQVESQLMRLPLARPRALPRDGNLNNQFDHIALLVIYLDTDAGHRGLGYTYSLQGCGRAMKAIAEDDLAPLLIGEDPLDHERLGNKAYWRLQTIGRRGLVSQVYAAVDLALWDIKGKAAGLPLYKLLGGMQESAPVYGADAGWLWMSPDEIIEASRAYLDQGMMGVKVRVGGPNPEFDAERLTQIREALGEDIWLGVDANQKYDYATALSMGEFFEGEIGVDWFEEPLCCEDVQGHARLAQRLELPIALGETLFSRAEFESYLSRQAVDILQPDITRLGGVTSFLKVAVLADLHHRTVAPHLFPEIAVHFACGLPNVKVVEYMPWHFPIFVEPPALVNGRLVPPKGPGLGLEIKPDALERYRSPQ